MTTLKNKIKIISPLPNKIIKKESPKKIIAIISIVIIAFISISILICNILLPYFNAVKIDKINGKKISITECNTKDFLIINLNYSYSMQLTNNECEKNFYEGDLIIKNNKIIFNYKETINNKTIKKTITGIIDINNNYNIIINNTEFESEKNE